MNLTVSKESLSQNMQAMEKYKSLIELNSKEPVNGNFNDCTDEILKELEAEDVEDDDDKENVD